MKKRAFPFILSFMLIFSISMIPQGVFADSTDSAATRFTLVNADDAEYSDYVYCETPGENFEMEILLEYEDTVTGEWTPLAGEEVHWGFNYFENISTTDANGKFTLNLNPASDPNNGYFVSESEYIKYVDVYYFGKVGMYDMVYEGTYSMFSAIYRKAGTDIENISFSVDSVNSDIEIKTDLKHDDLLDMDYYDPDTQSPRPSFKVAENTGYKVYTWVDDDNTTHNENYWVDDDYCYILNDKFDSKSSVIACITLESKDGYRFSDDLTISDIKVDGGTVIDIDWGYWYNNKVGDRIIVYVSVPVVPNTGDTVFTYGWLILFALSGALLVTAGIVRKKHLRI